MPFMESEYIRSSLTTEFGRAAFDTLVALGPRWVVDETVGNVYLAATIETREAGSSELTSPGRGWAHTADEAVIDQLKEIQKRAADGKATIVVNAYQLNRAEYILTNTGAFQPVVP